jgi:uncharacterized protein YprB with RNaseH-like and TPR domain
MKPIAVRIENSFIPVRGVGPKTERKLWDNGVMHWSDFSGDVVGETRAERIDSFIETARRRLDQREMAFFEHTVPDAEHWRLYENCREETCFLDIETTGLDRYSERVTTVSLHQAGETRTLVRGQDLTADRLRSALGDASLLVTFNGRRFDVPFLEASFDCSIELPHADLMSMCREIDCSGGLDEVERAFGIERDRPDISGRDAVHLWYRYERDGDDDALETLIEYNREDTENMRPLMDQVCDQLDRRYFQAVTRDC